MSLDKSILFCQWNSICEPDMEEALLTLGYKVDRFVKKISSVDYDTEYMKLLSEKMMEKPYDIVFSVNFIPIIARVCNLFHIVYVSWTVDSPLFQFYSETIKYECNRIFIFDHTLYQTFCNENPGRIFYMPLAANINHYDHILLTELDKKRFSSDISFIGSLYSEKCKYNGIVNMPDYLRGYSEGLIEAQLQVYGVNFLEEVLPEEIVTSFKECVGWFPLGVDYKENDRAIVAHEFLGVKCSEIERKRMLSSLAESFQVDLYTLSDTSELPKVCNKGPAHSRIEMPKIFKCSKINLNITSKTIQSGLSQRIFDVLGASGFLITNYQSEIPEYFEIGKDLVVYESEMDLIEKCRYYLEHDEERTTIATNGYHKVAQYHKFEHRFMEIMNLL